LRRLVPLPLFLFFCACLLDAQSQTQIPAINPDPVSLASRQFELFTRLTEERKADQLRHSSAARDELIARKQFWDKANQFVTIWEDFASRLNDKQTFDVKLAKKLSKAFHELEKSDGWPVREQTNR